MWRLTIAQASQDVWSWNREAILVPKGTYLTGRYERVNDGDQERVQIALDSLVTPDGWRTNFPNGNALDQTGQVGVRDKVNHHYAQIFLTAIAISGIGASASFGNSGGYSFSPVDVLRIGFSQGTSQAGQQVLQRYANRKPTLTIRPGIEINLFAPCDMALPAYKDHKVNPHL
jgi:type IV secretory pathway VirB10-like protein